MDTNNGFLGIKFSDNTQFLLSLSIVMQLKEQGVFTSAQANHVFELTAGMLTVAANDPETPAEKRVEMLKTAEFLRKYFATQPA